MTHLRSNDYFLEQGLKIKIEYAKRLANPSNPNPDTKIRYPNECDPKNANREADIEKRITREFQSFQDVKKMRLEKRTGPRRIQA